ncbi:MAG: maleylpyruvate isomerase family mycothiol-dependent enzyme [Acidimicrobiales bacterium]
MNRHDVATTRPWVGDGTAVILAAVDGLGDAEVRAPTLLAGWTRAHLVGHLARNAEALARLATWARTGVENPMYAGPDQRDADIDASAARSAAELRSDARITADGLDDAFSRLDGGGWEAQVRSAQGRAIPASEIPWMRVREVWVHAVDLNVGVTWTDLPTDLIDALADDVLETLGAGDACPSAVLDPSDRVATWRLGPASEPPVVVAGPGAALVAWLLGRSYGSTLVAAGGPLPHLPPWL